MQKIGIVGLGFVGGALMKSFKEKKISVIGYDKYKNNGIGDIKETLNTDICFLCLPTTFGENGYDLSSFIEVLGYYNNNNYKGIIVIKSTLTPNSCNKFHKEYGKLTIIHNPEFLSARTAYEDFHNQKHIVIGGNNEIVYKFYKKYYPDAEISVMTSVESESLKICANSFYAVKIQFFNEVYNMCEKLDNCNYNIVKNGIIKNGWVNKEHTSVPGSDGKLSYGGYCFPKDTKALLHYMMKENVLCKVLNATVEENKEMRD